MATVWILFVLSCDGHLNARCVFEPNFTNGKEECVSKLDEFKKAKSGDLSWKLSGKQAFCIPLSDTPIF